MFFHRSNRKQGCKILIELLHHLFLIKQLNIWLTAPEVVKPPDTYFCTLSLFRLFLESNFFVCKQIPNNQCLAGNWEEKSVLRYPGRLWGFSTTTLILMNVCGKFSLSWQLIYGLLRLQKTGIGESFVASLTSLRAWGIQRLLWNFLWCAEGPEPLLHSCSAHSCPSSPSLIMRLKCYIKGPYTSCLHQVELCP